VTGVCAVLLFRFNVLPAHIGLFVLAVMARNAFTVTETVVVFAQFVDVLVTVTVYIPLLAICALGTLALAFVELVIVAGPVQA
jgi:hypothetical protein